MAYLLHEAGARSATRAYTESFSVGTATASTTVTTSLAGLRAAVTRFVSPICTVGDPEEDAQLTLQISHTQRLPVSDDDMDALPRTPHLALSDDGVRYWILQFDEERVRLLRDGEPDCAPMTIETRPGSGRLVAYVTGSPESASRTAVRFIKFILGASLANAGLAILHASAVARDDTAVIIAGPTSSGKSTLSFLTTTLAGWEFVSDDMLFLWRRDGTGELRVSGWPNRVGIGTTVLAGHPAAARIERTPLRRYGGVPRPVGPAADVPWDREHRTRVYLDLDEFLEITGVRAVSSARPVGIVLPSSDRDRSGWHVERLGSEDCSWFDACLATSRQRKHLTDYLGILPPAPATKPSTAGVVADVVGLPCARVAYGPTVNTDFPRFWAEVVERLQEGPA